MLACKPTPRRVEGPATSIERLAAELGDVLFCVVNVCRYLKIDPGAGAQAHQRQLRAALPLCRTRPGGAGQDPQRGHPGGDGPAHGMKVRPRNGADPEPRRLSVLLATHSFVTSCPTRIQGSFMA